MPGWADLEKELDKLGPMYKLDEEMQVVKTDFFSAAQMWDFESRNIMQTQIGDVHISTVFVPMDLMPWLNEDAEFGHAPFVFESLISGGDFDDYQDRYTTKEDALRGHFLCVWMVLNEYGPFKALVTLFFALFTIGLITMLG